MCVNIEKKQKSHAQIRFDDVEVEIDYGKINNKIHFYRHNLVKWKKTTKIKTACCCFALNKIIYFFSNTNFHNTRTWTTCSISLI